MSHMALFHSGMRKPGMFCERVRQAIIVDGRMGSAAQWVPLGFIDATLASGTEE